MGGSTRCTALTLGAKALKSPVVPSEGLPHKKKPAAREPAAHYPHLSAKRKSRPPGRSGDGFRLPVNKTVRPVSVMPIWLGSHSGGPAMTEYAVKKIGHQWIVYADRLSIGACADEDSALKLIAEDGAANRATRKSTVQGIRASKPNPAA
jgi:hypothetical protein